MANYRKSFNFRNGVQVDTDNFIVNANGLVGIGTSIPTQFLDVRGNNSGAVNVVGLTTTTKLAVGETANFYGDLKVGSSVTIDPSTGDVSATRFVGDASGLTNIFAISTTGWVVQGVGLHTFRSVGLGTTNPQYSLQIGNDPSSSDGISLETSGNIRASGIVTATSFVGALTGNVSGTASNATTLADGANITTGTISDARLPNVITSNINSSSGVSTFNELKVGSQITMSAGIITATSFSGPISGSVTGNADSATTLETARNFSITGAVSAPSVSFDGSANVTLSASLSSGFSANTTGIITAASFSGDLSGTNVQSTYADVGIGTFDSLKVNQVASTGVEISSDGSSYVSVGKSTLTGNQSVELKYTPGTGRFDFNNYDVGGFSFNLHEGTGVGSTDGFNVKYDNTKVFEVTYDGKVGVNRGGSPLTRNFEVGGTAYISESARIVGVLTVGTGGNQLTLGDGSSLPLPTTQNFNTVSGISTFYDFRITNNLEVGNDLSVGSNTFISGVLGIGTTSSGNFVTGLGNLSQQVFGTLYSDQSILSGSQLAVTKNSDGSIQEDPRSIPSYLGSTVPYMAYGDFQVDVTAASIISESFLIVPNVGVTAVGFGSTNLGLIPSNYNTNKYLSKIGINTYFARSIFDVGTASTTMNSYFIPPSMPQSELDIVSNLWQATSGFGTEQAKKVTPNGVVPGGIVYNTDAKPSHLGASAAGELQVGIGQTTFAAVGVPIGGIIMWSGSIANIPNGWRLCDGTNGTPNLRDRFIVGAGSAYSVDDTGGSADAVVVSHTHTITDPGHDHTYVGQTTEVVVEGTAGTETVDSDVGISSTTSTETTGITIDSEGVSGTNANLPPYYALAFIMRTNA